MRIFSKRRVGMVASGIAVGLAFSAVTYAAATFGPNRSTFTWANPATYVTFNSITDNPTWGDERNLLKARDVNAATTAYSTDTQVTTDNQEVVLAVYFHNNAASNLNLVANNTRVKFAIPSTSATTLSPTAYISADNANPSQVWSTANLTSSKEFTVSYEPGTAKLYTNYVNGVAVSDSVVSTGALIGSNGTDGKVPGCGQFSGYVTIRVRVHLKTTPPPTQEFSCKALDAVKVSRTEFDFTAHATATNTTIAGYVFTAKDANGKVVDSKAVQTSALSASYIFKNSTPGTYTISSSVESAKGGTSVGNCVKQVVVEKEQTPPVLPPTTPTPTPAPLPNTGPGALAGLFAGASGLGAAGHFIARRRK